jgi:hypothetical protein
MGTVPAPMAVAQVLVKIAEAAKRRGGGRNVTEKALIRALDI